MGRCSKGYNMAMEEGREEGAEGGTSLSCVIVPVPAVTSSAWAAATTNGLLCHLSDHGQSVSFQQVGNVSGRAPL